MEPAVSVRNLTKIYKNGKVANNSIDLDIERGTLFAILGPNGAGKTTFVRQITMELLPTSGEIRVLGFDARTQVNKIVERIGVVPQEIEPYEDLTVFEHVYYIARLRGLPKPRAREDTNKAITQMDLGEYRDKLVGSLSGGLKRRTIVAAALTGDSELLVLDEPSTGLDPVARRNVGKVLRQKADEGKTVVLTTHYVEEAEAVADKVAIFDNGKVALCDKPETIRSSVSGLFRLTLKSEFAKSAAEMADLVAALSGIGLNDVKAETNDTIVAHIKANERPLLSAIFDWALKNGLTANIAPITLEDAYIEFVK